LNVSRRAECPIGESAIDFKMTKADGTADGWGSVSYFLIKLRKDDGSPDIAKIGSFVGTGTVQVDSFCLENGREYIVTVASTDASSAFAAPRDNQISMQVCNRTSVGFKDFFPFSIEADAAPSARCRLSKSTPRRAFATTVKPVSNHSPGRNAFSMKYFSDALIPRSVVPTRSPTTMGVGFPQTIPRKLTYAIQLGVADQPTNPIIQPAPTYIYIHMNTHCL
jgi:hypothetical protein